jgi:hypothetical protein
MRHIALEENNMVENSKTVDPTSYGLFLVAFVSLPIALVCLIDNADKNVDLSTILMAGGILILVVSLLAFKADSNFGLVVFGLVGLGVFLSGCGVLGLYGNITLAITYILALIWSVYAATPKLLTFILLTTALIFLFGGLFSYYPDSDIYKTLEGISALANFALTIYLSFALALENKIPIV